MKDWAYQTVKADSEEGKSEARHEFIQALLNRLIPEFDEIVSEKVFPSKIWPMTELDEGDAMYEYRIKILERGEI